ncbi:MAG TPA: hypothetical protein VJW20_22450 [Candidatus Angelobacter sp.]|nr:hypothetical protein [Candidatus Angelobacter sp.]
MAEIPNIQKGARAELLNPSRPMAGTALALTVAGNGENAPLGFVAPTPGHFRQRFKEVNQFPVIERPENPGVMSANKAPAIRNQTVHRFPDTAVPVPAGINAILCGKTSHIGHFWYIQSHKQEHYISNQD